MEQRKGLPVLIGIGDPRPARREIEQSVNAGYGLEHENLILCSFRKVNLEVRGFGEGDLS